MEQTASLAPPAADRLTGTIRSINDQGYGFLSVGSGQPHYFLHCSDIPPHAWVKGAVITFTPTPPKKGGRNPRISDAVVVSVPHGAAEVTS